MDDHNQKQLVYSSIFLALSVVLPTIIGKLPQIGRALCPMHFPVLICGFICGPTYASVVGAIAPVINFLLTGKPSGPTLIAMTFELMAYGTTTGILSKFFPSKTLYVYISLVTAMIIGRILSGIVNVLIYGLLGKNYTWEVFVAMTFVSSIPGIVLQLLIVPPIINRLAKKSK